MIVDSTTTNEHEGLHSSLSAIRSGPVIRVGEDLKVNSIFPCYSSRATMKIPRRRFRKNPVKDLSQNIDVNLRGHHTEVLGFVEVRMGLLIRLEDNWEISDGLWEKIEPVLLTADPPKATGRRRVDQRRLLNAVVYKLSSGCRWNSLPRELGDDSTVHRAYQRWVKLGVFNRVLAMLKESQELPDLPGTTKTERKQAGCIQGQQVS